MAPAGLVGEVGLAGLAGLVGEVSGATKRSRKPLPINPLTGQVIGGQAGLRQEVRQ